MYPIQKILVGLDFSDMDEQLIKFAMFIARHSEIEKIYFVHVVRDMDIPKDILKQYPDITGPVDEDLIKKMRKKVKPFIDPEYQGKMRFEVKEGSAFKAFSKMVKVKDIDLIVVGKKKRSLGMGFLLSRLGRGATCALLIVPEGCQPNVSKILVPIDESIHSDYAITRAVLLAKNIDPNPVVVTQSIYIVPEGYHRSGKTYWQFARIMKNHAQEHLQKLLVKMDMGGVKLIEKYTLDQDMHPSADIFKVAKQQKANLIVIGAKAVTPARALFRRSVAEKLVRLNDQYPLLIVRMRKKVGIIESVRNL